ncbi:MAG: GNAT family N-acetyltransferase [Acidimicrobiales bacterium]
MTDSSLTMLDNMAWHALVGPQRSLAQWSSNGRAVRYQHKISPICAIDQSDDEAWAGLAELASPKGYTSLFRGEPADPAPEWREIFRNEVIQYVADELAPPPDLDIIELGPADPEEMVALTKLTEQGPFSWETHRTGRYFGLRQDGQLVAMAGERMRVDGWGEVSAVCVHPDGQRQGLGEALTLAAAKAITDRGDRAMLHVRDDNHPAHRLYLRLGFEVRRTISVGLFRLIAKE